MPLRHFCVYSTVALVGLSACSGTIDSLGGKNEEGIGSQSGNGATIGTGSSTSTAGGGANGSGAGNSGAGAGASGSSAGGGTGSAPASGGTGTGGLQGTEKPDPGGTVGPISDVQTALPPLPFLRNVTAIVRDDSAAISFEPVEGAVDYRVYPLPADGDISVGQDGLVTVKNAIYRCSGDRQTFNVPNNLGGRGTTSGQYSIKASANADNAANTLGYVFLEPGDGRIPVYATATVPSSDENSWRESRPKIYTMDASKRAARLAAGDRDDGVVFYVPAAASGDTAAVYGSAVMSPVLGQGWTAEHRFYFGESGKSAHTKDSEPAAAAFQVLKAQTSETVPLMTSVYSGSHQHTELSAGIERFTRAINQGNGPIWQLNWAGMTASTVLVVEALATGCPYQGFLAPTSIAAGSPHPAFETLAQLKAKSESGEVFVNGQHDDVSFPKAIARSFIKVDPKPTSAADWDFFTGFHTDLGTLKSKSCTALNCGRWDSTDFEISSYLIDKVDNKTYFSTGQMLGQLWVALADFEADVTGKARFTANKKATIDSDASKFLHATMSTDIVATDRRYPQLIISDRSAPVQEGFASADQDTILLQPITGPSSRVEIQAFHGLVGGKSWDVNNQAPEHRLVDYDGATTGGKPKPADPPLEHAGMDRLVKFDIYASSERVYVFMDDAPVGCSLLPTNVQMAGEVTVSVGDVLYHPGAADEHVCSDNLPFGFLHRHQCTETKRRFDDVGFKSGVGAPVWDESRFPCSRY
jgi:hypothetical protein